IRRWGPDPIHNKARQALKAGGPCVQALQLLSAAGATGTASAAGTASTAGTASAASTTGTASAAAVIRILAITDRATLALVQAVQRPDANRSGAGGVTHGAPVGALLELLGSGLARVRSFLRHGVRDRKSTRLNSSHVKNSYAF